ncbi:MAG: symmetrical bis(5'-nucleosyl)-tetraphosphatase [Polaromonas sp.]
MSLYLIGDLQGCDAPLKRLLDEIDFSPSRDTLYLLGDLVNRGPDSLGVLLRLSALGDAAQCLLGNHDLHALAVWQGVRKPKRNDTLQALLAADDNDSLFDWLRHRPMAIHAHGWLMVHAGVLPQWTLETSLALAAEVENVLRGNDLKTRLTDMYGNTPAAWHESLTGSDRLRAIINTLTRLRFCTADGLMDFTSNDSADNPPDGFTPWFDVPNRLTKSQPIAFGHWSTLMPNNDHTTQMRSNALPLDTGCVWGGCLTAAKLGQSAGAFELIQVKCEQALKPG